MGFIPNGGVYEISPPSDEGGGNRQVDGGRERENCNKTQLFLSLSLATLDSR